MCDDSFQCGLITITPGIRGSVYCYSRIGKYTRIDSVKLTNRIVQYVKDVFLVYRLLKFGRNKHGSVVA